MGLLQNGVVEKGSPEAFGDLDLFCPRCVTGTDGNDDPLENGCLSLVIAWPGTLQS